MAPPFTKCMGQILQDTTDYNAVRAVIGLDADSARLLTNDIIDAWPHLPLAEAEMFDRNSSGVATLLARDPMDYQRGALKASVCALTCAFLCRRLQQTVPIRGKIELGEIERDRIDWEVRRNQYISDSNWAWSLTGLGGKSFPKPLDIAQGSLYKFDPLVYSTKAGGSDFSGYVSPFSGYAYQVSLSI